MTKQELRHWRSSLGLTQKQAGQAIGVCERLIRYYEQEDGPPIPRKIELACKQAYREITEA